MHGQNHIKFNVLSYVEIDRVLRQSINLTNHIQNLKANGNQVRTSTSAHGFVRNCDTIYI